MPAAACARACAASFGLPGTSMQPQLESRRSEGAEKTEKETTETYRNNHFYPILQFPDVVLPPISTH